ncbi:hypothetical protein V6N12_016166 [Hibiscus sabdariffa]|uniref:Uncharacterized protein n=1 Tax=Hibiscus sabdariffa TaxID=183260 RepID=A0ABR2C8W5_9ROSI
MSSQGEWRKRRQAITLYVNNISETLHWKGLWQAFGRHGEPRQSYWRKVGIEPSIKPQASGSGTRRNSFTEFKERTNNPVTEKKEEVENKSEMGGGAGLNGDKRMRITFREENLGKEPTFDFGGADMGKGCSIADQELVGEEPERGVAETVITKNGNRTVKGDMENEKKGLEGSSGAKEGITHKLGSNTNQGVNLEAESTPCSGRREKEDNGVEKTSLSPIVKSLEIESEGVEDWSSASEEEGSLYRAERVFFPELDAKQVIKKRYGLLMKIQGKSISEKEHKKRDRAVCKEKLSSKGWDMSELSGRSLSDSDLVHRWKVLTKKAKKGLALGKRLGAEIEGNEEGAVRELAFLESSQENNQGPESGDSTPTRNQERGVFRFGNQ